MDIGSLTNLKYTNSTKMYNIMNPEFRYFNPESMLEYEVQKGEEMRIDLIMMSMYQNYTSALKDIDVICFINDIDNPLNISVGDILLYPAYEALQSYRYVFQESEFGSNNVIKQLSVPNKTQVKDPSRKKFVDNGYSLPPVVLDESKPPVRLEQGYIVVGGIN